MEPQKAETPNVKSNQTLYIVIAVVVLLILGWIFSGGTNFMTMRLAGVNTTKNMDGSQTFSNDQGSVTMGSNSLPDNWPSDAPKYPNASIQYSGSSNPQTGSAGIALMFTTTDSAQNVVNFYKKELPANGWKIEQTATMGQSTVISATKIQQTFGVNIVDSGNGQVTVTVGIELSK